MRCDEPRLIHALRVPGGEGVTVRPVCPQDSDALQAYVRALSPDARYKRFFGPLRELPPAELDRVIHLHHRSRLALMQEPRLDGASIVIGEARYALAPDRLDCEFAVSVADGWRGKGLGSLLLGDVESRARSLGARRLVGDVLRSNAAMQALARKAGFAMAGVPGDARL